MTFATLQSLMTQVEDIKGKISDGEYLNLCNTLKKLHDEINEEVGEERESDSHSSSIPSPEFQTWRNFVYDDTIDFNRRLNRFFNFSIFDQISREEAIELFNIWIRYNYEVNNDESRWIICPCQKCFQIQDAEEHFSSDEHSTNFTIF